MGLTVLVSLVLDANHLFAVYPDPNSLPEDKKEWRSPELAQACQALQHQSLSGQPVWILSNLSLKPTCAFSVATYAFNAVENPDLHSTPSHTVAVLANSNYQPFLEKKFPEAAWQWLPSPAPDRDSGLLLGIISSSPPNSEALGRWVKAENFLLAERDRAAYRRIDYDWSSSVDRLKQAYGLFQGDPFLESIYWEKLGFYDASGNRLPEAVEDLRMALLKGYPSANLFYSLGVFLNFEGKTQEARQAFEMALHCPVNRTAAGARLEEMGLKEPPL